MSNIAANPVSISFPRHSSQDGSWLAVIAKALAKCMTQLQDRMVEDANQMSVGKDPTDAEQKQANEAKADLQVAGQQYAQVVNALNTVIKTVGQADAVLARKQ